MTATEVKRLVDAALIPFSDGQFGGELPPDLPPLLGSPENIRCHIREQRLDFLKQHGEFVRRHGYEWIEDESVMPWDDWLLQIQALLVLADIPPDHPEAHRCGGIIIRKVASGRARVVVVPLPGLHLIVIPSGYLMFLKEMIRIWIWGQHLGGFHAGQNRSPSSAHRWGAFLRGLQQEPATMLKHCDKLLRLGIATAKNDEWPRLESVRHGIPPEAYRDLYALEFAFLCHGADAYVVCHEIAHVLKGHDPGAARNFIEEGEADQASLSLGIIYGAVNGAGPVACAGGAIYFAVELLRLLIERITAPRSPHLPRAIEEIQIRMSAMPHFIAGYTAPPVVLQQFSLVSQAMGGVFDCCRYALLEATGKMSGNPATGGLSLHDFVIGREPPPPGTH